MSLQEAEELKSVSENGSEVKVEINQDESEIKAEYAVFEEQALLSELQREHEAFAYTAKALGVLLGEIPTPTDIDIFQFTKVHDIEMAVVKITREIEAARRVELKLIKDAEKAVAEILEATLSDTGKVQEYKQKVDSVVELLQQLRIGYALPGAHFLNLKKLRTRQGNLMRKQIGLDDDAAFYKEHEKVKNELEYFDGEGMALLRMVTSWKVRRLRERNKELSVIADLYKDLPIPRFKKEIFEKIDALVFKVVRDVSRKITSRFDHEITKITRLDQQKNQPDEKSIEKFNDALIADKFLSVIKDWKKSLDIKRYKSDIEEKQLLRLSDPEYVKKLTDLLKRGFKVRAEGQFGGTTKEKSGIDAEIRQLMRSEEIPYEVEQRMESMLASPIRLPGKAPTQYTPDHRYTDFSDAISLLGPKKKLILVQSQTEFMDNLAKEVCGAVEKRKYEDQRGGNWRDWFDPYDLRALREGVSKGVQSDAKITKSLDGSKEITAIVERFDIERWAAYRGVSEVREKFGDEVIDLVDEVARTKALNEVYAPEGDVSKRISGASVESLFKYFRDVETMVIAFIASYSNNDIASPASLIKNTLPYKILASLTEEERAELVEQPIPGIKEFVELMMANPDAPNNEEWTKEDRSKIRNPNYAAMREALVTMCIEFPAKDSRQQDFFYRSIQHFNGYLTGKPCDLLIKLANDSADVNKRILGLGALYDGVTNRNIHAARAILRNYSLFFGPAEDKRLEFNEAKLLSAFITGGACKASNEDLATLSQVYGETPERLLAAINLGNTEIDSGRSYASVFSFKSVEVLRRFIDFAHIPGVSAFLKGLHDDANSFLNMDDIEILTELALKKEEFFADIVEIRKRFSRFKYSTCMHERTDPKTGEKSYIKTGNPYEVLVLKNPGVDNFLNPWLASDGKTEKIPEDFASGFMSVLRMRNKGEEAGTPKEIKQFTAGIQKFIAFVHKERAADRLTPEQSSFWHRYDLFEHLSRYPDQVELVTHFSELAPELLKEKKKSLADYILKNFAVLVHNKADLVFVNKIISVYGGAATQLIEDYKACLENGILSNSEESRRIIEEILGQFRNLSPEIVQGYVDARRSGSAEVYLAGLRSIAERLTGSGELTQAEREKPYFQALIRATYQNNSGSWTSYSNNESCADRSADLAGFKIKPCYEIDLLSAGKITIREGEKLDMAAIDTIKNKILIISQKAAEVGYDPEKMQKQVAKKADELLAPLLAEGGIFSEVKISKITTTDEKLFLLLMRLNSEDVDSDKKEEIKSLLIEYEFAAFEDVRGYVAGTADRVRRASNQEYALLCELNTFFADRIKEVNRRLAEKGFGSAEIAPVLENIFYDSSRRAVAKEQQSLRDRLQVSKLGLPDEFLGQITRVLRGKTKREYPPEKVREIIARYEARTGGLSDKTTESVKSRTRAFYGQLKSQRERTASAVEQLTGQEIDLKTVRLGEINLEDLLKAQSAVVEGKYNQDQFAAYTLEKFLNLFEKEKEILEIELGKFQSEGGKDREVLNGYITKSKESAHARMVGGVCVSGDNPAKQGEKCQWNMENYIQMVFQDPETLRCQGVVLMHHFTEPDGKRVLTASLNPSSTYLYGVDERALFRGIKNQLEIFAKENNFDIVALSQNPQIRTNRTGGEFEKEMEEAISKEAIGPDGGKYVLSETKDFSFNFAYQIKDLDIIWRRP